MSRYRIYDDRIRFDSALDLSNGQPGTTPDDLHVTQTDMNFIMAPWSEYNTRTESFNTLPCTLATLSTGPYTIDQLSAFEHDTQAFSGDLSAAEPTPPCPSPGAMASANCSSSSMSPILHAAGSSATAYSTMPSSSRSDSDSVLCGHCGCRFTGKYRHGNLRRHVQHKHLEADQVLHVCFAEGCSRTFKRRDALLKHARNKHPELHLPQVHRRHGTEQDTGNSHVHTLEDVHVAQDPTYNVGQWLQVHQGFIDNHTSKVQREVDPSASVVESPRAAHCVFTTLQKKLHPSDYSRVCDSFFTRWESIVQQLKDDHSTEYSMYARVFEDVHTAVQAIDVATYGSYVTDPSSYLSRSPHNTRAGPRGHGRSNLVNNTSVTSSIDRVSKQGRKQLSAIGQGKHVLGITDEYANKTESRKVDCPVYKHNLMHGIALTCRGRSVDSMAQVRNHLKPTRTSTHGGFLSFIAQCSRCKHDFVAEHLYDVHNSEGCTSQPQTRNDIGLAWARQYIALYPDAVQIPIPWTNENGWLPQTEVRRCRASFTFLGEHPSRNNLQLHTPLAVTDPPDESRYREVMSRVLDELTNPVFIQSPDSPTPRYNPDRQNVPNLQTPLPSTPNSDNQYFLSIVHTFETNQRAIRQGAMYLTAEQLLYMARECERMSDITRGMYQRHSSPHTQVQTGPALMHNTSLVDTIDPMYITPLRARYSPNGSNSHLVTPGASTQPSSSGYNTGSSQIQDPSATQPSSTSDPRYLTPDSSTNRRYRPRRTSELSPIAQDTIQLRRGHSYRSLPDDSSIDASNMRYHNSMHQS